MKIIDLLNKIANGEEVPKKIKYANIIYKATYRQNGDLFQYIDITNDEEYFSYYCVPLRLNDEVEILDEEKKIPEKLKILNANDHSKELYYKNYSKEEISLDIETLQFWVNKIIDHLKSKGE